MKILSDFGRLVVLLLALYPLILISAVWPQRRVKRRAKSVLYLAAFWEGNAGYEYRVARWAAILNKEGYQVDVKSCFSKAEFDQWVKGNSLWLYIKPAWRRFYQVLRSSRYETVLVRRELLLYNEYGNLFLERLLLKLHPQAILDFDDDLSAAKTAIEATSIFGRLLLQTPRKFEASVAMYRNFLPGSPFLASRFLRAHHLEGKAERGVKFLVLPTCVDYENDAPRDYEQSPAKAPFRLGWIGSVGNLPLLDLIVEDLSRLHEYVPIELVVISGKKYEASVPFPIRNVDWSMRTQLDSLRQIDVGLMPLSGEEKDSGKCGFKLIQYMGLGIVSVASSVGVNREIVEDNVNGYLVTEQHSWFDVLYTVLDHTELFTTIGKNARLTISNRYSFTSNTGPFIRFLEEVRAQVS